MAAEKKAGAVIPEKRSPEELLHKLLSCTGFDFNAQQKIASLIHDGADLKWQDRYGNTPLHIAASNGHLVEVRLLLAAKAEINAKNKLGNTPLQCTTFGTQEMHKTLISDGAQIDAQNDEGNTLLISAAEFCRKKLVRTLLDAGADPLLRNTRGWNALDRNAAHVNDLMTRQDSLEIKGLLETAIRAAALRKIEEDGMKGIKLEPLRGRWVIKKPKP